MAKKILLLLFCCRAAVLSFAQTSGIEKTNLAWKFDSGTGTLTISGTGVMQDYPSSNAAPWSGYASQITRVEIGNGVVTGYGAFQGCSHLTSIRFGNSETIGSYAFGYCSGLTSVTIPGSVTNIGYGAFWNCSALTSITIDNGVESIGNYAFGACSTLRHIYTYGAMPPTAHANTFVGVNKSTCILHVPVGSKQYYEAATGWKDFLIEEEGYFRATEPVPSLLTEPDVPTETVAVYPNPVSEIFYINGIEDNTTITLFDTTGKTVLQAVVSSGEPVFVAHLSQGMYMLQVAGRTVKLIKN